MKADPTVSSFSLSSPVRARYPVSFTRQFPSGAWELATILGEGSAARRFARVYHGFTRRDALREFRADVRVELARD